MAGEDSLSALAKFIVGGLAATGGSAKAALSALFGERYQQKHLEPTTIRDAYGLATDDGIAFAGLINPDNPPSQAYGGTSIVWFPTKEHGSLIGFGVGTRGIPPDEGILLRPGHRRRIRALRRYLARRAIETWTKSDPAALDTKVPKAARDRFPGFEAVFNRYGSEMYCNTVVPRDLERARRVVQAFFDLYAYERGWLVLKKHQGEFDALTNELRGDIFPSPTPTMIVDLLKKRQFVVLQGAPGTGKTRLCGQLLRDNFHGLGMTVQFHPAVTYEDFIIGLAPKPAASGLAFDVRHGWLLDAIEKAGDKPFLLVIDEINRADLSKVLGEAIHLFEAGEVGEHGRAITLPHASASKAASIDGATLRLPKNLYVLATMNTADRSIAGMDLAVRRRFAFVTVPPSRDVVAQTGVERALHVFDRIQDVFVEHAPDDALDLMPGHSYFLAKNDEELVQRFRYELLPLLDEYLRLGMLGTAAHELATVRDHVEDVVHGGHAN